ncbi:MAG: hypothetical protein KBT27_10500 [Prevotellaceae bacterium]|nr:hypothetical protein [Candidatus Faecinaster equi]
MSKKNATEQLKKEVYNDILRGNTQSNLVNKITTDYYNVGLKYSVHTAKDLISEVRRIVRADYQEEQKFLRESNINRLLDLYNESFEVGDRSTALKTLQEMNKMCGLYESEKLDVTLNGNVDINFGFDE